MYKLVITLCLIFISIATVEAQLVKERKIKPNSEINDDDLLSRIETYFQDSLDYSVISDDTPVLTDCIEVDSVKRVRNLLWLFPIETILKPVNVKHEILIYRTDTVRRFVRLKSFVCIHDSDSTDEKSMRIISHKAKKYARKVSHDLDRYIR